MTTAILNFFLHEKWLTTDHLSVGYSDQVYDGRNPVEGDSVGFFAQKVLRHHS